MSLTNERIERARVADQHWTDAEINTQLGPVRELLLDRRSLLAALDRRADEPKVNHRDRVYICECGERMGPPQCRHCDNDE